MKKYFLVVLVAVPLMATANSVLKDTIKTKRKYEHSKSHITHTLNNTKRDIEEITSGTYVQNQAKREAKKATSKYTNKVEKAKNVTNPERIKRKANNELNRKIDDQFDEWLYEE